MNDCEIPRKIMHDLQCDSHLTVCLKFIKNLYLKNNINGTLGKFPALFSQQKTVLMHDNVCLPSWSGQACQ